MDKKVWLSRRAIKLHVVILIVVPAFLALCLWQVSRALGGNSLSWAYVFEWPIFAALRHLHVVALRAQGS